jgi:hypothetical protein
LTWLVNPSAALPLGFLKLYQEADFGRAMNNEHDELFPEKRRPNIPVKIEVTAMSLTSSCNVFEMKLTG